MTATVLAATLLVTLTVGGTEGWLGQNQTWQISAFIFLVGMIVTSVVCIFVNRVHPQLVAIAGIRSLGRDRSDDGAHESTEDRESDYFRLCIEYSLASARQEQINKKKARRLDVAYGAFAISLLGVIPALVVGLA